MFFIFDEGNYPGTPTQVKLISLEDILIHGLRTRCGKPWSDEISGFKEDVVVIKVTAAYEAVARFEMRCSA
jgi:hypothetical protein